MKNKTWLFLFAFIALIFLAPGFSRECRAQITAVQVTGDVPATAADSIANAGFDSVIIYYSPYRKPDDTKIIGHLKSWGAKAAALHFKLYVKIDTGPPLDAVADNSVVKFRPAASDDGYPQSHKPAPASAEFWKTAIFPKLDTLAQLASQIPLKGVYINLANHVEVSYDAETYAEFLKVVEPETDPATIPPIKRKDHLIATNHLKDYEKFQEDRIYFFTKDYMKDLKSRAPKFEIELASYQDNPLHRAFLRVVKELQPGPETILYTFHTAADKVNRPLPDAAWIPVLSVREFPPDELEATVGALNLRKDGYVVSDAESLWLDLKKIKIADWPLGLPADYLGGAARAKKAGAAETASYQALVNRISQRVAVYHNGAPRIALIYSGYKGYMFRDVFDGPLAAAGIKLQKFENTKLEKLVPRLGEFDAIFAAPGYNAVKSAKLAPFAKDLIRFVDNGGLLFILDGSLPAQIEWMGQADPALKISVEQKDGLTQKSVNSDFKMLGYPYRITKFTLGKFHFIDADPGWRALAIDNQDKPFVVQRIYGDGMIVALANFDVDQNFMLDVWEHMLKVMDRFDVAIDPNTKPLGFGRNEVRFVITTNGHERKLKITARILNENRKMQKAETRVTLTNEGGARFAVPLNADAAGLYQVILTFSDEQRDRVDRRDTFSFLAPPPFEAQLDKSYYTKEPEALLRVACRRTEGCGKFSAAVTLAGAAAKLKQSDAGMQLFALPIGNMKPGSYTVKVAVKDKAPKGYSYTVALGKLTPSPIAETKLLNFRDNLLEVNGEPFFPLGIYSIPPENMDELAKVGVNAMIYYGDTAARQAEINAAVQGKGIKYAAYPLVSQDVFLSVDHAKLKQEIEEKAKNPNMFMWYLADEPEGFGQSPELIYDVYKFVKEIDPYRPEAIVMMTPSSYADYVRAADVFMFDRYPTPVGQLDTVGLYAQRAVQAVYGRKPVFAIPQAFSWEVWDGSYKEGAEHRPNYTEMRSSAVQCIAAGVKGIIYWAFTASRYDMRKFPDHVKKFESLMSELAGLMDVLQEPNAYLDISVAPDFQGINWGAKLHGGKLYLFTYNGDAAARDTVTFTLPKEYSGKTVEVNNENRTLTMDGRSFTDSYELHGAHIYGEINCSQIV